jgi:hypothetical protein
MLWNFHGLTVEGLWEDEAIGERWLAAFASRPQVASRPELSFRLALSPDAPPAPSAQPDFQQGELLAYYINPALSALEPRGVPKGEGGPRVTAHFPRFGQLHLDLSCGATTGVITPNALVTYGVFEDLIAIGLSPHFRRRGRFLIHAFAATPPPLPHPKTRNLPLRTHGPGHRTGVAVLLVGDIGAGKTTTGLALLHAGWKLLSNDSPILTRAPHSNLRVLAYPGLLSAYPDTLARFPELAGIAPPTETRQKTLFAAESIYPDVWVESAPPAGIVFPQVESRADHALERLPAPEALRLILPHAIEQWDREMIPAHLALLNQLVQSVPAYRLRLGPDSSTIPAMIASAIDRRG